VDVTACRIDQRRRVRPATSPELLVQDREVQAIHEVLDDLQPIAVHANASLNFDRDYSPVRRQAAARQEWSWKWTEIRPVQPEVGLNRIRSGFDGEMEHRAGRLCRALQAGARCVVEPAVIGAGNAPLLD